MIMSMYHVLISRIMMTATLHCTRQLNCVILFLIFFFYFEITHTITPVFPEGLDRSVPMYTHGSPVCCRSHVIEISQKNPITLFARSGNRTQDLQRSSRAQDHQATEAVRGKYFKIILCFLDCPDDWLIKSYKLNLTHFPMFD